jgi:hypothetical protein
LHSLHPIQRITHLKVTQVPSDVRKKSPSDSFTMKQLTVILGPPAKVAPTDDIIEEKANEHPGHVVKRGCRRHVARAGEDEREVEIFEEPDPELLV